MQLPSRLRRLNCFGSTTVMDDACHQESWKTRSTKRRGRAPRHNGANKAAYQVSSAEEEKKALMATQLEVILSELVAVQAAKDKASADNMVLQKTLISTMQELKDQAATHDARLQKQALASSCEQDRLAEQLRATSDELAGERATRITAEGRSAGLQQKLADMERELEAQAVASEAHLEAQASRLHADIARLTEQLYAAQGAAETVKAHNEDLQQQLAAMERAQPAASPEKVEAQAQCLMPEAMPTEAAQLSVDAERPAAAEEKIQQLEDSVVTLDVRNQYLERVVARQEAALEQARQELHTAKSLPRMPLGTTVELSGSGQLGVGGRGTVCEVIVKFSAAAKIPKQSGIAQAELANEAAALTAIGPHPNIIEAHGWAHAPQWQTDVLLLELAHDSLFNQICSGYQPDKDSVLSFLLQLVEGVLHVHAAGFLHRDIKPGNTLLYEDGRVKLCDFGCASDRRLPTGIWKGTPPYLTSQTLFEETEQGVHDDVHAVCVTAYDLMCGQAMFDALDDKYQSLSDNVRKGCEAFCQRKLACSAEEVDEGQLLAAAEIHGLIAIEEVVPAVDGLPQELLDAILLGITNPWALSLTRLRDILDAAVEACSEDGTSADVSACSKEAGCSNDEEGSFTDDSACEDEHGCCGGAEASCKDKELASGPEIYIQVDTCIQGDTAAEYIPLSEKEDDSSNSGNMLC